MVPVVWSETHLFTEPRLKSGDSCCGSCCRSLWGLRMSTGRSPAFWPELDPPWAVSPPRISPLQLLWGHCRKVIVKPGFKASRAGLSLGRGTVI